MTMWGPWIEHDGKGWPVAKGEIAEVARANGACDVVVVGASRYVTYISPFYPDTPSWWHWAGPRPVFGEIIRYRVKKPRGLEIIEGILADVESKKRVEA